MDISDRVIFVMLVILRLNHRNSCFALGFRGEYRRVETVPYSLFFTYLTGSILNVPLSGGITARCVGASSCGAQS